MNSIISRDLAEFFHKEGIIFDSLFVYNDEEILTYDSKSHGEASHHEYEYTYELLGDSCTEGYAIIETCKVCGIINDISFDNEHDSEDVLLETINLEASTGDIDFNNIEFIFNYYIKKRSLCFFFTILEL